MKIQFRIRGLNAHATWQDLVMEQLHRLKSLTNIEFAEVILEKQRNSASAVRAHVHLAVPGPDIHAEARDHTLEAAWLKVTTALRQQIERRKSCQQLRHNGHRQHPLTAGRWSGAPSARGFEARPIPRLRAG